MGRGGKGSVEGVEEELFSCRGRRVKFIETISPLSGLEFPPSLIAACPE